MDDSTWKESEFFRVFAYYDNDAISLATHGGDKLHTLFDGYVLCFYVCEDDMLMFSDGAAEPKLLIIPFDFDWFQELIN